jgi:hypothetical protein
MGVNLKCHVPGEELPHLSRTGISDDGFGKNSEFRDRAVNLAFSPVTAIALAGHLTPGFSVSAAAVIRQKTAVTSRITNVVEAGLLPSFTEGR